MTKLSAKGMEWLKAARKNLQILLDFGVLDYNYEAVYDDAKYPMTDLAYLQNTYNKNFDPTESELKKYINDPSKLAELRNEKKTKHYRNIELNNKRFQDFAFATHPDAYNPKKMSELPAIDLAKVMLAPDFNEWRASETWLQAFIVAGNLDYNKLIMVNVDRYQKPQNSVLTDAWEVAQETGNKIKDELLDVLSYQNIQSFINQNVLTND